MTAIHSRRGPLALVALLSAGLPLACGDDGGDGTDTAAEASVGPSSQPSSPPSTDAPTGEQEGTDETGGPEVTGDPDDTGPPPGDTGDTGETGDPTTGGGTEDELAPVVGVPNVDDDDQNGQADWQDAGAAGDDDIAAFALPGWYVGQLQAGDRVELSLAGEVDQLRFWRDGAVVLGAQAPAQTLELAAADAGVSFGVEFADFLRKGTLTVRRLGSDNAVLDERAVPVIGAPLIINHHMQPAEFVWAVQAGSNAAMIDELYSVAGDKFIEVNNPDIWIQDELVWAPATAPGGRLNIAMDSIRDRELDGYVKSLKNPDIQPLTWGQKNTDTTEDKFGNLEVTPPHGAGGKDYPFGRIYYGDAGSCGPNPIIKEFMDRQRVQAPIHVNTCWLCVGHVDEFISFVPDSTAPRGFRFLIADVPAAYALLESMNPNTSLPRYQDTHGYSSVGELLDDDALRALNEDLQADYLDTTREMFKQQMGLADEEILRIPGLFERIQNCSYKDNAVAALIPGMLNLTVVNFKDQTPHIFVSDPFMRGNGGGQDEDPFINNFRAMLPDEFEIHFVDDWYTYHVAIGEVHCGTNVARAPIADWWTAAMPLINEEP
jgi:hypothetical protein